MSSHPLVPGDESAIERGPWHYGADYVTVYFKGDPRRLSKLLPSPYKVLDGSCMAYVCEIISVSDKGQDLVWSEPDRTRYMEAAVGVACAFNDKKGMFFPVMWVDTEWSLLRGLLNGYQKRLADKISMTHLHPLNPGINLVSEASTFGGFCVKGSKNELSVKVKVERQGKSSDLHSFGATFGYRRFPQTDPSQGMVDEAVEILKSNSRSSDVWLGEGTLRTGLDVGEPSDQSGAVYRSGFTISGSKVLRA
jgi:Acetoacetate decarboxylase (ADC)